MEKIILTGDVNLDKPDLSSTVRVEIFIGRYFSRIYFAIVVLEIQFTQNLISRFMFYLKIMRFFFQNCLFSRFALDFESKIQKILCP